VANITSETRVHIDMINRYRQSMGRSPLRVSQILTDAALFKARSMANEDYFSHTEPSGRTHRQLLTDFGYPKNAYTGENILYGTSGAEETFDAWYDSPPHRDNMMNPNYTEIGVALGVEPSWDFSGDVYLVGVQMFGSGNTPTASEGPKVSEGVGQIGPKKTRTTPRPEKPRVPRFAPPVQERDKEPLGKRIKNAVKNALKRRK
jgi:hypothetical protein